MNNMQQGAASPRRDENAFLEQHDAYILMLARKRLPRCFFPQDTWDMDVDDLAQLARIKLWKAFRKREIEKPNAYIGSVVSSEAISMARRMKNKEHYSLPLDDYGEPDQLQVMMQSNDDDSDPLEMMIREERFAILQEKIEQAIAGLAPQQLRVIICTLKDSVDEALKDRINELLQHIESRMTTPTAVEEIVWPTEPTEKRLLKASLSAARKNVLKQINDLLQ